MEGDEADSSSGGALISQARPQYQAKSDYEYCRQNQKQCGLLKPCDRRHRESHRESQKADLQGQKIDSSKKSAERQQCQEHQTRTCTHKTDSQMLTWMCRPTSV